MTESAPRKQSGDGGKQSGDGGESSTTSPPPERMTPPEPAAQQSSTRKATADDIPQAPQTQRPPSTPLQANRALKAKPPAQPQLQPPELTSSPIKEITTHPNSNSNIVDEIPHILSSISDGGEEHHDEEQQQAQQSPSHHFSPSESAGKIVHDFFYPKRQSSKSDVQSPPPPVHKSIALPSLQPTTMQEEEFEDEHAESDTHQDRLAEQPQQPPAPRPSTDSASTTSNTNGNCRSSMEALNRSRDSTQQVEEQQDKAFVEKFWTAYDEIIILSLFTQVGILCRLGAASFFRYFDGVFHSGSALFTNLPLNCLSCFVMGMLCSGESLMQIINTRFTPPRLQQDLHREATQQSPPRGSSIGQSQSAASMEDYSSEEEMMEMETEGAAKRRMRRRRKRSRMGWRRRKKRTSSLIQLHGQQHESAVQQELREVQLMAWERRIRASVCLLLFPVRQEDVDVVESYFSDGYRHDQSGASYASYEEEKVPDSEEGHWVGQGNSSNGGSMHDYDHGDFDDLILQEEDEEAPPPAMVNGDSEPAPSSLKPPPTQSHPSQSSTPPSTLSAITFEPLKEVGTSNATRHSNASTVSNASSKQGLVHARGTPHLSSRQYSQAQGGNVVDYGTENNPDLDQIIADVATGASNTISRFGRVNLAEGWDVGTSPQEKSEDLCLGLRDGLCGALSSFSSWISSMVNLFRTGEIGQAIVGLILGIQLPIVAYRFGQYVSVYVFVWRCRRQTRRDERMGGYGLRLQTDEEGSVDDDLAMDMSGQSVDSGDEMSTSASHRVNVGRTKGLRTVHDEDSEVPSVRAIITALSIMCLVAQITSLQFFYEPEDRLLALSLLFSPLGVLARWRMMKFNAWRPSFPLGTFACNVAACALSGTLGSLLAGNPGPKERIALVAVIAGFGGTLSSVARFIVETLSLMDPVLFRLDGVYYAVASAVCGVLISFLFSASVDWADSVE